MKVLTYTSYKEHCDLYTEIHGSIAVNSCQNGLAQKGIILLSMISIIFYKAVKHAGVEKINTFINFRLPAGTYSIDDFNTKIKEVGGITTKILSRLVYLTNILKRLPGLGQPYPLDDTKHPLLHHLLQNYYHYTVNRSIKLKTSWMVNHQIC